mmetsp:Transcript_5214/g.18461  ORF Transcript_5214/g.18461 Transcript_5214/m.18461 type:complete len:259 (+) Transcript_5214:2048-2824(+)
MAPANADTRRASIGGRRGAAAAAAHGAAGATSPGPWCRIRRPRPRAPGSRGSRATRRAPPGRLTVRTAASPAPKEASLPALPGCADLPPASASSSVGAGPSGASPSAAQPSPSQAVRAAPPWRRPNEESERRTERAAPRNLDCAWCRLSLANAARMRGAAATPVSPSLGPAPPGASQGSARTSASEARRCGSASRHLERNRLALPLTWPQSSAVASSGVACFSACSCASLESQPSTSGNPAKSRCATQPRPQMSQAGV